MDLKINDSAIVWPGGAHSKPVGFMIPTHLQVLTIEETPFVFVRRVESYTDCRSDEEPCPHFNTTETGNYSTRIFVRYFEYFFARVYICITTLFSLNDVNGIFLCMLLNRLPCDVLLQRLLHRSFKAVEVKDELYCVPCTFTRRAVWQLRSKE